MSDYPRVLYHTAIKRPRNIFGKLIEGAEPVHDGDLANPNYPTPNAPESAHGVKGRSMGEHLIPQHHYRTMTVVKYFDNNVVDEEASKIEEERLTTEGWVRHPDLLKEEYDEE